MKYYSIIIIYNIRVSEFQSGYSQSYLWNFWGKNKPDFVQLRVVSKAHLLKKLYIKLCILYKIILKYLGNNAFKCGCNLKFPPIWNFFFFFEINYNEVNDFSMLNFDNWTDWNKPRTREFCQVRYLLVCVTIMTETMYEGMQNDFIYFMEC